MKVTGASPNSSEGPLDPNADTYSQVHASLLKALFALDSIDADTAIRARLQGIVDDLEPLIAS